MIEEQAVKVRESAQGGVVQHLSEVSVMQSKRISTGLSELDRVTGGGLLSGTPSACDASCAAFAAAVAEVARGPMETA